MSSRPRKQTEVARCLAPKRASKNGTKRESARVLTSASCPGEIGLMIAFDDGSYFIAQLSPADAERVASALLARVAWRREESGTEAIWPDAGEGGAR